MLKPGQVSGGFRVDDILKEGMMAVTYKVARPPDPLPYTLKLLFAADASFGERLRRAAAAQAQIDSPHLVKVLEIVEVEKSPGVVSEWVTGAVDLHSWIGGRQRPMSEVIDVFRQVVLGVEAAHAKGLIDRNLKPAKVLVAKQGDGYIAKVNDFMLGKVVHGDDDAGAEKKAVTQMGTTFGTPQYMAPEQFRGAAGVDHRGDLWSLGCLLYEMVTASRAFDGKGLMEIYMAVGKADPKPPSELRPDCPRVVQDLLAKMLVPDPDERIQSATAILEELGSKAFETLTPAPAAPRAEAPPGLDADATTTEPEPPKAPVSLVRTGDTSALLDSDDDFDIAPGRSWLPWVVGGLVVLFLLGGCGAGLLYAVVSIAMALLA